MTVEGNTQVLTVYIACSTYETIVSLLGFRCGDLAVTNLSPLILWLKNPIHYFFVVLHYSKNAIESKLPLWHYSKNAVESKLPPFLVLPLKSFGIYCSTFFEACYEKKTCLFLILSVSLLRNVCFIK